jgi:hypothetical protein
MSSRAIAFMSWAGFVAGAISGLVLSAILVMRIASVAVHRIHDDAVRYGYGQYVPSPSGGPVFKWNIPEEVSDE